MKTLQREALEFWFKDHDTINLAQVNAGIPDPRGGPPVRLVRVAPYIYTLRNEGWRIATEKDAAGVAHYRVVERPGAVVPGEPGRTQPAPAPPPEVEKADPKWTCSKPGCLSGVVPDITTSFDSRYTTGKCFTHGKQVLVRR